jgi:hypothetical protein
MGLTAWKIDAQTMISEAAALAAFPAGWRPRHTTLFPRRRRLTSGSEPTRAPYGRPERVVTLQPVALPTVGRISQYAGGAR